MKYFLKVTDWKWVPGSDKEMMYKDDKDEWFVGPPSNVVIGKLIVVEITDKPLSDGYHHIVKFGG